MGVEGGDVDEICVEIQNSRGGGDIIEWEAQVSLALGRLREILKWGCGWELSCRHEKEEKTRGVGTKWNHISYETGHRPPRSDRGPPLAPPEGKV